MDRLTKAQQKLILDHGPFRLGPNNTVLDGNLFALWSCQLPLTEIDRAIVAALNAVASEPESVAVAREALLSACTAKAFHSGEVVVAAINYSRAHHAAKRARK